MINRATQILHQTFGYSAFRGEQAQVIDCLVEGQDALVLMPTGGGKSLCYQIPGMIRNGMAIVVSPLIALMQDQVNALQQLGVRAAYLNSSLSREQHASVLRNIVDGEIELLYIAPERLLQDNTLERLRSIEISLIAIDEAHCVSQWGHDFRSDYLGLHVLQQAFPNVPRVALTATADARTQTEIIERLALYQPQVFVSSFDRPNIRYVVQEKGEAKAQLLQFLQDYKGQAGIVYCMTRNRVDGIAAWLGERGFNALPYHAGLDANVREQNQARFLREEGIVMVATIAFGMGIDKPDVRFVCHLDLPKSIEAYYQETGRAGRDGEPSVAWMIYGLQDVVRLSNRVQESQAAEQFKRTESTKLDALLAWCEANTCRRRSLLRYFGESRDEVCGNCDVCLNPPKTWDATEAAQKLLSNIYRTGQRFGAGHVVDVLRGKDTAKVRQFRHQDLSTYGIGQDLGDKEWRSIIRQLMVQGFLTVNEQQYNALQLTEQSRGLLRGDTQMFLRKTAKAAKVASRINGRSRSKVVIAEADQDLWDALKAKRKAIADEYGVPPFHIFHDSTLAEMVSAMPSNQNEMLDINGIGLVKMEKFGQPFLATLDEFRS